MPHVLRPMPVFDLYDRVRFWSYVDRKSDNNVCWLWLGKRDCTDPKHHQPRFSFGTRKDQIVLTASRVAYYLGHKIDPGDLLVCHECDNQLCMNPTHLWLGTQKDNMMDCSAKGRIAIGNGAILAPAQVIEIRRLYHDEGFKFPKKLSERYGVTPQQIYDIVVYKKWKDLR